MCSISPRAHASDDDRRLEQVAAVLGEEAAERRASTWWPARPTRCRPAATDLGDSTCTTRSIAPMSMPSSSDDVATSAGRRPGLQHVLDLEPLLAGDRAVVGAGDVLLGELVQAMGDALGGAAAVHEDERRAVGAHQLEQARVDRRPDRLARLAVERRRATQLAHVGTGTITSRSSGLRCAGVDDLDVAVAPPRNRAISSSGRWVAESPTRCTGRRRSGARAARARAPGASRACSPPARGSRRRSPSRTPASISRAADVRIRYSDSGVVIRMSGGWRRIAARSRWGVSPLRTATVTSRGSLDAVRAARAGSSRCRG